MPNDLVLVHGQPAMFGRRSSSRTNILLSRSANDRWCGVATASDLVVK